MTNPYGNLVGDKSIPREDKLYLGDGLYAVWTDRSFYLQAYNGIEVQQSVYLDEVGFYSLVHFARKKGLQP